MYISRTLMLVTRTKDKTWLVFLGTTRNIISHRQTIMSLKNTEDIQRLNKPDLLIYFVGNKLELISF